MSERMTREALGAMAANRFGMGAREGDIKEAAGDPKAWLAVQLDGREGSIIRDRSLPSSKKALAETLAFLRERGKRAKSGDKEKRKDRPAMRMPVQLYLAEIVARTSFAIRTEQSFRERLARFWSNHFTIAADKAIMRSAAGAFEREAIRPHVAGKFADMLLAVERHPMMLVYLDNVRSFGPNSRIGRRRGKGLNENLAREILELHTLGVDGGYGQSDVEELARAITGWTTGGRKFRPEKTGEFVFAPPAHEPGARTVLGKRYAEGGLEQGEAVLRDLARHPSTAKHIATKLARHFVADNPPRDAVNRLTRIFLDSGGDLGVVSRALLDLDQAWRFDPMTASVKVKTPEELLISAARALKLPEFRPKALRAAYRQLGQRPFSAPSPEGWPDVAEDWIGPDAIKKRLEWARMVSSRLPTADPRDFLETALGPLASVETRTAVGFAASGAQGLTLALMSPEFQRR